MTTEISQPIEVAQLLTDWALRPDGALITTRSSWLLPVRRGELAAMLKVARTRDEHAGYRLMRWWNGHGAARVFAADEGALLLERSLGPGDLVHLAHEGRDDDACRILCRTAARLHEPRQHAAPDLHPLEGWFRPLFEMAAAHAVLAPAAATARALLADPRDACPLHGDLHHRNVLDFGERGWLAVDPHGLRGERAFDFANIFTNPDLGDPARPLATLPGRMEARLDVVAQEARVEPARLVSWIVAWTGLSAAWFIGDNDERGATIDLAINAIARNLQAT